MENNTISEITSDQTKKSTLGSKECNRLRA